MIRFLSLILLMTLSIVANAQAPSNYTNINGRYRWIAGMFDSTFHIPKGTTPSLRTGGSTNSGGLFYNTTDSSVYTYTGTQWIKLRGSINPSDTTNKYVTQVYKKTGSDSIFYVKGGSHIFAFIDSVGSGGGGGGGGKIYYLNGGVSLGTFGGFTMYELGDTAVTGSAANFTRATTGNIANFITDVNKPGLLQIPAGVWTIDAYLSETGGGSNHAQIYAAVEKWNGSTITTIATSPIEEILNGSTIDLYTWSVSIPTTTLAVTDRIIIQFYIQNTNGKTVTLYTQNGYVGEVHTTFTTGIGAINGLTAPAQYLVTGTSGTDFNISSVTATHTFNLPTASATNRGALSTTDWSTFNNKIGPSDTASMLSPYLRKVDTASLSNRINLKLNISDTASMLSPYLRSNVASATYVPQSRTITINGTAQDLSANRTFSVGTVTSVGLTAGTGISVSGSPVTGSGSMTVTNTAPDQTVVLNSGTGISISGTYPSFTITNTSPSSGGTVTSVGTNNGTGLTGGTITTAGTLAIDTSLISTRLWRQKGIDSVQSNLTAGLALKVNISDTSSMLSPYLRKIDTTAMLSPYARKNFINAGTGISYSSFTGTIANTAPDQTVAISSGTGISVTGTYPNFTITNTSPSSGGTVTSVATNNGTGITGGTITSAGTLAIDTVVISTRAWRQKGIDSVQGNLTAGLATKLNISDTASMLSPYLRKVDTASLSNRINTKLNISDTATMLGNYVNNVGYGLTKASQVISADSATLSAYYLRRKDSLTSTNLLGYVTRTVLADSAAAIRAGSGTISGSGTTNRISKFTASGTIGNSSIADSSSSVAMTILSNGNIGINTTAPSERLEIVGTSRFTRTTSPSVHLNISMENGFAEYDARGSIDHVWENSGVERMRLTLGGNLGVGTASPDSMLTVLEGVRFQRGVRMSGLPTAPGTRALRIDANGTLSVADTTTGGGSGTVSGTTNYLAKFTSSTAVGDSRFFDNGTITFLGNGDVNAAPSTAILSGTGGSGTNIAGAEFRIRGGAGTGTGVGGPITFYTSAAGSSGSAVNAATERARFTSAGLGIGTTTPLGLLHLEGTNYANLVMYSSLDALDQKMWMFQYGTAIGAGTFRLRAINDANTTGNNALIITRSGTTLSNMQLMPDGGNVGIGTSTIGSRLQVNGNAAIGYSASTAAPTNGLAVAGNIQSATQLRCDAGSGTVTPFIVTGGSSNLQIRFTSGSLNSEIYSSSTGAIRISTQGTSDAIRIENGGNIGIGTATIGSKLQVNGNAAIGYSASTAAPTNGLAVSGNVGIGTSNPAYQLELFQASADPSATFYRTTNGTNIGLGRLYWDGYRATNTRTTYGYIQIQTENTGNTTYTGNLEFNLATGGTLSKVGFVNGSGNWGFGTTTIGSRLQVNGNASIGYSASTAAPSNGLAVSGDVSIGTTTAAGKFTIDPDDNQVGLAITGTSLTSANAQSLIDLAQTWNTTGNPTAIKLNITNTTSGASAYLMDLQIGGTTQFRVTKDGSFRTTAPTGGTAANWKVGTVATVTPTSPNRTIEIEIDGVIYYIHAKTTNN